MKVAALNGSPRKGGNTEQCLKIIGDELNKEGIDFEIIQIGHETVRGCVACYNCLSTGSGYCIQKDKANEWIDKMVEADGIILASPVYYGGIAGTMKSFLDRAFLAAGNKLHHKVGAAITTLRRSGGLETFQQLNAYLNTMEMIIPSADYWAAVHGLEIGEVKEDTEGLEVMSKLGRNMAWIMKVIEASKGTIDPPVTNPRTMTNFIR
ncbi:flavodoxin family protein [Anaerosacchariphilus polymeriproducens]|uniref:Flavodoxin family protein n=1 Tax=Anaerosacchariphilus polymeriproducens TaxID=1812858 RepID=A0A371AVC2_9FIRM|nr:flavodoxin family protein [Anaerosacchariphilus polymeriproducens]RDU23491.1 flavodoxin family protein [Anaerosacchariphilus polymeriproducens]